MSLIATALLLLAQDPIEGWIRDLGAEEPAVREEAQRKLLRAGEKALPALKEAQAASSDAEVRFACERLIKEIGDTSQVIDLIDPHPVTLERGEYTLAQVAEALSKSGRAVKLDVADREALVTVGWSDAPLMRALDELCAAHGKLGYLVGKGGDVSITSGSPVTHPVGYAGPVRVDVASIEESRSTSFDGEPKRNMTVTLRLSSLNPTDDVWKEVLSIKTIELEDGTALGESKPEDEMGLGGIMGGGAVVRILGAAGGGRSADHTYTFKGAPRSAARLGAIRGSIELTMPVGEEVVTFTADEAGTAKKIGDYTIKLESFKRGKAQISFKNDAEKSSAASDLEEMLYLDINGMGGADPKRADVQRRLDFEGVVGVDENGEERKLETDWKKSNARGMTVINGQVSGGYVPTITVEAGDQVGEIRFTFRARSTTRTYAFEIADVPLPE